MSSVEKQDSPKLGRAPLTSVALHARPTGAPANSNALVRSTLDRRQLVAKRVADVAIALLLLILLAPLILAIATAVRATTPGPALFRQERYGLGNRLFRIYKFRTMYLEAGDPTGVVQAVEGDSRVTPLGRMLRRTNFDELPQLLNVLRGEMSMVGPRPHVPGMLAAGKPYEELVPDYPQRHAVRPGITGLAQVNGLRGPTTDAERARARIEADLIYVQTQSITGDLRILALTVWRELTSASGI